VTVGHLEVNDVLFSDPVVQLILITVKLTYFINNGHSVQTPEEKTFWASLSDSVKAETVLE